MIVVLLYMAIVVIYIAQYEAWGVVRIGLYSPLASLFLLFFQLAVIWLYVYLTVRVFINGGERPFQQAWEALKNIVTLSRIVGLVLPVVIISIFNSIHTSFKATIGTIEPYHFDPLFAALDKSIHGGVAPWQITHGLISTTNGTLIIDLFYTGWFFVMWGFLFWQIFRLNHPMQRQQFLLSYVLCWSVIGTLFAHLLASAGPCYYGMVTDGSDLYAPLMERLHLMKLELLFHGDWRDLRALNGQEYLRAGHLNAEVVSGGGISAMPSMHVSMAMLFMLSAWQINKIFGWLMLAYLLVIIFGSVHLGWHYAVDGYVSVLLTIIIWLLSGQVVRVFHPAKYAN